VSPSTLHFPRKPLLSTPPISLSICFFSLYPLSNILTLHSQCNEEPDQFNQYRFTSMSTNDHEDPSSSSKTMPSPSPSTLNPSSSPSSFKLRKIPPIPIRRIQKPDAPLNDTESINNDDGSDTYYDSRNDGKEILEERNYKTDKNSPIIMASALGLNHIRTRSLPVPSPLRFSSSAGTPSYLENAQVNNKEDKTDVETRLAGGN